MIKLIAMDMDHTLLDDRKQLPERFPEILQELKARGITVVIASGRPLNTLKGIFGTMVNQLEFISDNGGQVEYHGEIIYKNIMDLAAVRTMIQCGNKQADCMVVACALDHAVIDERHAKDVQYIHEFYPSVEVLPALDQLSSTVNKLSIFSHHRIQELYDTIYYPKFGQDFEVVIADTIWLDITNIGVNKGVGILKLRDELGITAEECMAFGDYYNDVELLKQVEYSFVMENAPLEMRQYGKYLAPKNTEDGVMRSIERYVLADK